MSLQRNEGSNWLPPHPPSMVSTRYVHCRGRSSGGRGLGREGGGCHQAEQDLSPGSPRVLAQASSLLPLECDLPSSSLTPLISPLPPFLPGWPCLRAVRKSLPWACGRGHTLLGGLKNTGPSSSLTYIGIPLWASLQAFIPTKALLVSQETKLINFVLSLTRANGQSLNPKVKWDL